MFYPVESLRRGGRFYLCWVADSWPLRFETITRRQLWSQDIREICTDLLEVMKNESGRPTYRFSLRLSSQLLRGLVRLYQRKVTVFVGDICMINAHVMKITHKKFNYEESEHVMRRSELPRIILEIPDEEAVEERIQNSGNVVAHIEDITLREPTLPGNIHVIEDGFGEVNPEQLMQGVLGERSMEVMLFRDTSAHTALDVSRAQDSSIDKHHERSRLAIGEAQMERLSEHDISVFGKSMGEGMVLGDLEKEIPEIPDLPLPDPPHTDKDLERGQDTGEAIETSRQLDTDQIVLETLEEPPPKRRKKDRKNKLLIDKKIKLSSTYIRSRIKNNNAETRPQSLAAPHPAWFQPLSDSARPLGAVLALLQRTAMELLLTRPGDTHRVQEAMLRRHRTSDTRSILGERRRRTEEAEVDKHAGNLGVRDGSREMEVAYTTVETAPETLLTTALEPPPDYCIADLPTQKLLETSQAEREPAPKRSRSGYVSFRHSQQRALDEPATEANKENIPQGCEPSATVRLRALLQRDGLADSELASETPLGSLDRTKVSLGDSDITTDSKRFIREEWGTQGAMHKIYRCIKSGTAPLDVGTLLSVGPLISGHRRVIAARCFTSILKLKQHGFIRVYKDSETYEIKDITLGSKITQEE